MRSFPASSRGEKVEVKQVYGKFTGALYQKCHLDIVEILRDDTFQIMREIVSFFFVFLQPAI